MSCVSVTLAQTITREFWAERGSSPPASIVNVSSFVGWRVAVIRRAGVVGNSEAGVTIGKHETNTIIPTLRNAGVS